MWNPSKKNALLTGTKTIKKLERVPNNVGIPSDPVAQQDRAAVS
jgi:hypothetical protein